MDSIPAKVQITVRASKSPFLSLKKRNGEVKWERVEKINIKPVVSCLFKNQSTFSEKIVLLEMRTFVIGLLFIHD